MAGLVVLLSLFSGSVQAQELVFTSSLPPVEPARTILQDWAAQVEASTQGAVRIRWQMGAIETEDGLVAALEGGQVQGALILYGGPQRKWMPALQMYCPSFDTRWRRSQQVQEALNRHMNEDWSQHHVQLLGWGDLGDVRLFGRDHDVSAPAQLSGRALRSWEHPVPGAITAQGFGASPAAPSVAGTDAWLRSTPDAVIMAPGWAMNKYGWSSSVRFMSPRVWSIDIHALVVREDALAELAPQHRELVRDSGYEAVQRYAKAMGGIGEGEIQEWETRKDRTPADDAAWNAIADSIFQEMRARGESSLELSQELCPPTIQPRPLLDSRDAH